MRRASQPLWTVAADNFDVAPRGTQTPHPRNRRTSEPERPVSGTPRISHHEKRERVLLFVGDQLVVGSENDEEDIAVVAEFIESVAHGDRVSGARQSIDVAVKDEDYRSALEFAKLPVGPCSVDELEVGSGLTERRADDRHFERVYAPKCPDISEKTLMIFEQHHLECLSQAS